MTNIKQYLFPYKPFLKTSILRYLQEIYFTWYIYCLFLIKTKFVVDLSMPDKVVKAIMPDTL